MNTSYFSLGDSRRRVFFEPTDKLDKMISLQAGQAHRPVAGYFKDRLVHKLRRRAKTDAKDAVHLTRLLRLGEVTPVAVPTLEQESARDLVRARQDARGELMRARHRLSKLLLRHRILYSGGRAWTGPTTCDCAGGPAASCPREFRLPRSTPITTPC
jgi:hypothetical protein